MALGSPGGLEAEHEPSVHPDTKESHEHLRLNEWEHRQQVQGSD